MTVKPHPARENQAEVEATITRLLELLGYFVDTPGLNDTPRRVAAWWAEFLDYDPGKIGTTFEQSSSPEFVIVSGLRTWSLCEHHLLPFWCDVAIGYKPAGRVLGLSKFGRVAVKHARRLQLQERLVTGIGQEIMELTGSSRVAVLGIGEHLCMTMRGIEKAHRMATLFKSKEVDGTGGLVQQLQATIKG